MKLRSALLALVLAVAAVPLVHAQDPSPAQRGPGDRRMQMMFKDITLTPAQQTRVDSVLAHYRTQMGPMTPGSPPDSAAMAARRSLMQKQSADIRALLTREQQPVFDRNLEEMRAAMQRRQGGM
jgi:Spy/CpxP family protein refolding chaperone